MIRNAGSAKCLRHEGFCEVIQFVGGIFIENDTLVPDAEVLVA